MHWPGMAPEVSWLLSPGYISIILSLICHFYPTNDAGRLHNTDISMLLPLQTGTILTAKLSIIANWILLWLKYSWSPNSRVLTVSGSSLAESWHCSRLLCAVTFSESWLIYFLGYHLQLRLFQTYFRGICLLTHLSCDSTAAEVGGVTVHQQSPGLVLSSSCCLLSFIFSLSIDILKPRRGDEGLSHTFLIFFGEWDFFIFSKGFLGRWARKSHSRPRKTNTFQ